MKYGLHNFKALDFMRNIANVLLARRMSFLKWSAAVLAIIAAGLLFQTLPGKALRISYVIPSAQVMRDKENTFRYELPLWVGTQSILDAYIIYEDGVPLNYLWPSEWGANGKNGSYVFLNHPTRFIFRARDGSDPKINGRVYSFKAPLISPGRSLLLSVVLVGLIGLMLGYRQIGNFAWNWRWLLLAMGLAKLWAVAGGEIVTLPHDSTGYAISTNGMVWWAGRLPSHPAGFPAIAGIVSQFGVPWRLALEIFYLLACGVLASVIAGLLSSRVIACLLFTVMAWHPWTFSGFADFMSDPLLSVLTITMLTMMFRVLGKSPTQLSLRIFLGLGLLAFFWNWCRIEDPLVYGSYGLFAVLAWWLTSKAPVPISAFRRIPFLVLPLLLCMVLSAGVKAVNYAQFGVYAKSGVDMPGLLALMKALYKVKPEQQIRYAAVTRQSLGAACDVSPLLKPFKDKLLDPRHPQTLVGERYTKIPGEFGPWLNWLLPSSIPGSSVQEHNALMMRAAAEVSAALRSGRIPSRSAHFPFDPNWRLWLPDLLPCIANSLSQGISMKAWRTERFSNPNLEPLFDEAANRRASQANPFTIHVEGRIHAPSDVIQGVLVVDHGGVPLATARLESGAAQNEQQFFLRILKDGKKERYLLGVLRGDKLAVAGGEPISFGPEGRSELSHRSQPILLPDTEQAIEYSARAGVHFFERAKRFQAWEQRAEWICRSLTALLAMVTFAVVFCKPLWTIDKLRLIFACWLLVSGWLLGRAFLYGILNANVGWPIGRYMQPIAPIFILVLVLGTALASCVLQRAVRRIRGAKTPG